MYCSFLTERGDVGVASSDRSDGLGWSDRSDTPETSGVNETTGVNEVPEMSARIDSVDTVGPSDTADRWETSDAAGLPDGISTYDMFGSPDASDTPHMSNMSDPPARADPTVLLVRAPARAVSPQRATCSTGGWDRRGPAFGKLRLGMGGGTGLARPIRQRHGTSPMWGMRRPGSVIGNVRSARAAAGPCKGAEAGGDLDPGPES